MLFDIGAVVVTAALMGVIAHTLRQPIVVAYILVGVLLGARGLGIITNSEEIVHLGELHIIFLLFLFGLELDWRKLSRTGPAAIVAGLGQMALTALIAFGVSRWLGFSPIVAGYFGLALMFSSTIIVVQLLDGRHELNTVHGRLLVGVLLIQDIVAVLAVVALHGMASLEWAGNFTLILSDVVVKTSGLAVFTWFASTKMLPKVFRLIGGHSELQTTVAIAWGFLLMWVTHLIGLSAEVGALIAGMTLAVLPQGLEVGPKVRPMRDLFTLLFFASLGLMFSSSPTIDISAVVALSALVLIVAPLTFYLVYGFWGFRPRTAFLASLPAAQISEFSLIIAAFAVLTGHLEETHLATIVAVAIVTFTVSTYLGMHSPAIYRLVRPLLLWPRRRHRKNLLVEQKIQEYSNHLIIVGGRTFGNVLLKWASQHQIKAAVIDIDPVTVSELEKRNELVILGDAGEEDVLHRVQYKSAKLAITTTDQFDVNLEFIHIAKRISVNVPIFTIAQTSEEAVDLYAAGADFVLIPHHISSDLVVRFLEEAIDDPRRLKVLRDSHVLELRERRVDRRRSHHLVGKR